tara:strand:- start:947 stop:1210 length:264 start_codon:yes stop_codon:yes gene_type:complete
MVIYIASISGQKATIKKVNVKNKQQAINMLNGAVENDSNLHLLTDSEVPHGVIYKGNKKQLKESIKKHYALTNYTSYTIIESSQYNK